MRCQVLQFNFQLHISVLLDSNASPAMGTETSRDLYRHFGAIQKFTTGKLMSKSIPVNSMGRKMDFCVYVQQVHTNNAVWICNCLDNGKISIMKLDSFVRCPAKYLGNIFALVLFRGRYEPEPSTRDAALLSCILVRDGRVLQSPLGRFSQMLSATVEENKLTAQTWQMSSPQAGVAAFLALRTRDQDCMNSGLPLETNNQRPVSPQAFLLPTVKSKGFLGCRLCLLLSMR